MASWHITPGGKVNPCHASIRPCIYGSAFVFNSKSEADKRAYRVKRDAAASQRVSEYTQKKKAEQKTLNTTNLPAVKTVAVDIDDTVGDFEADFRLALARRDGISFGEAVKKYPINTVGMINAWYGGDADACYEDYLDLERRGLLYRDQPVRKGAGEVLNWLYRRTSGQVVFLTARPAAFNPVSIEWLKYRVGIEFPIIIRNSNKKETIDDYDVLIDDSVPHALAVSNDSSPHGARPVIFMGQPRTAGLVAGKENISTAWDWEEVKTILDKIVKRDNIYE